VAPKFYKCGSLKPLRTLCISNNSFGLAGKLLPGHVTYLLFVEGLAVLRTSPAAIKIPSTQLRRSVFLIVTCLTCSRKALLIYLHPQHLVLILEYLSRVHPINTTQTPLLAFATAVFLATASEIAVPGVDCSHLRCKVVGLLSCDMCREKRVGYASKSI
jgi:hypothetical protein